MLNDKKGLEGVVDDQRGIMGQHQSVQVNIGERGDTLVGLLDRDDIGGDTTRP